MIDILYLAHGRSSFTYASLSTLKANTDLTKVRLVIYTDGEPLWTRVDLRGEPAIVNEDPFGGPVAIMNHYLMKGSPTDIFVKLDNDVIVPPGWLERGAYVMGTNPTLGLLGIEPPSSTIRVDLSGAVDGCVPCDSIGGIGFMRRRAFDGQDSMRPHSIYGGFTDWQIRHPEIKKAWLAPPLKLFLLDRLPIAPWRELSASYIAMGQQRAWASYPVADSHLWEWWTAPFAQGGPVDPKVPYLVGE